jgi:hypothetical protein
MRVELRARSITINDRLRAHAERRLRFALGRFGPSIRRVCLRLDDVNGPRGGVDKCCRLVVGLTQGGEVIVEDADGDLRVLLDRSADRAGRAVERRLERLREPAATARRPGVAA